MRRCPNSCPNNIQAFKPAISGCLVANTSPDPLLAVQPRLIGGQIIQVKPSMGLQELENRLSPMPTGPVHIQKYPITSELFVKRFQDFQESFPIAFGCPDKAIPTQKRRYPSRYVEPLGVLAGRGDSQANPFLGPTSAKPGMKRETRLVLKDNSFTRPQILEFFLKLSGIGVPESFWLGGKHGRPVSVGNPTGASTSGPDGLSKRFRSAVLSEPQASVRPTGFAEGRTCSEIVPGARLAPNGPFRSNEPVVQDEV